MFELYVSEYCPYSHKVLEFLNEEKIPYAKRDIAVPENGEKLLELGGQAQVPFLHDTDADVKMYESDDIIKYIRGKK
jgi:glutathione S-transferase